VKPVVADQRVARRCRCGAALARDRNDGLCRACETAALTGTAPPPQVPATFWEHPPLADALVAQHMGQVIRAYRRHPWHGTAPLSQEAIGRWLNVTQCQVSRLESGPPRTNLDWLRFVARTLSIPAGRLWFTPDAQTNGPSHAERVAAPAAASPSSLTVAQEPHQEVSATVRLEVTPGTQLTVTLDQDNQAPIRLLITTLPEAHPNIPAHPQSTEGGARVYSLHNHRKHA
jgi:hypothetical protein